MKKILFFVLTLSVVCSIIFAKSSSGKTSKKTEDGFIETYDMVSDITTYEHKDLKEPSIIQMWNLYNSLTGNKNVSLCIKNKTLVATVQYRDNDWLFIEKIIFLDSKNNRLELSNGNRIEEVLKGNYVSIYEKYYVPLSIKQIEELETILKNGAKVCFVGSQSRTDLYEIKDKVTVPMLATIEKWRSLWGF